MIYYHVFQRGMYQLPNLVLKPGSARQVDPEPGRPGAGTGPG
jgi:hypothetical protein